MPADAFNIIAWASTTGSRARHFRPARRRLPAHRIQRGVSLVESCVVLGIACGLASAAIPAFTDIFRVKRLEAASSQLIADTYHARMRAVLLNEGVRITQGQTAQGHSCYVVHTGAASACDCGRPQAQVCDRPQDLIKVHAFDTHQVTLRTASQSVLWHPTRSTITPTATYRLALPDGREVHHVVNIMGRTRTCSPNGAVRGHPRC